VDFGLVSKSLAGGSSIAILSVISQFCLRGKAVRTGDR
jgi:hypothetical protein